MKYIAVIDARIAGIPCKLGVTYFDPGCEAQLSGPPELCYEGELPYAEYDVLDQKGYKADWLKRKISPKTDDTLQIQIAEALTNH